MGRDKTTHRRKLSSEEARERFIFITKDALDFFPPIGTPFELAVNGERLRVEVSAIPCECVGTPHKHYRIEGAGLSGRVEFKRGVVLRFTRGSGGYSLE